MSDTVRIDVDTTALNNVKNSLTNAKQKLESGPKSTLSGSGLELLKTPEDFASSYLTEMANSIDEIINATNERITGIDTLIASLETSEPADETSEPVYVPPTGDDSSSDDDGGRRRRRPPSGDDDSSDDDSSDDDDDTKPPKEVSIPVTSLGNIPVSSLVGLMSSVIKLAALKNKGLDELLTDEKFADDIKKALLESGFLPGDLKQILTDSDSIVSQKLLKSIVNGEYAEIFSLSSLNIGVVYKYLKQLATDKGISLEEFLTGKSYVKDLKTALSSFSGPAEFLQANDNKSAEEYQKSLSDAYDGNVSPDDVKAETVSILRTFVDYVSDETEISSDELLNNTAYAEVLKVASQGFVKSSVYASICGAFSDAKVGNQASTLLYGGNPEALEITKDEHSKFKAEVDSLAREKGTTADKLLSEATYADDVKKLLENSTYINGADSDTGKSTNFVSNIYKDEDSKISQKVASNIYKAQVDDSTTFVYKPAKTKNTK